MELQKIKKQAQKVIKEHKVEKVFATADGQIFLPTKELAAKNYALSKGNLKIYEIKAEVKKELSKK